MSAMPLIGDELEVRVTKVLPFGALVETDSGTPGLVRGDVGDVRRTGIARRVEVIDVDESEQRFSARLI